MYYDNRKQNYIWQLTKLDWSLLFIYFKEVIVIFIIINIPTYLLSYWNDLLSIFLYHVFFYVSVRFPAVSLCVSLCLSICLSLCFSLSLSLLSLYLFIFLTLSSYLSIYLHVCLLTSPFVIYSAFSLISR